MYREKVFYPFVHDIRKNYYLMPDPEEEGEEIPSSYTAISWMDGCSWSIEHDNTRIGVRL